MPSFDDTHSQPATAHGIAADDNSTQQQLEQLIHIVSALSNGDYMVDADTSTDLGRALQVLINQLRDNHSDELDTVVRLSMCANETSISSARLFHNLTSVDEKAQAIAAAAEELQATAVQIRAHSQSIHEQNHNSTAMTDEVSRSLQTSISAFEKIRNSVLQNAEKVSDMGSFAKEIRDIADAIKGIAFQTNLLALNASVEAARAGAVGAGFGVVAHEMRSLAQRSSDATKQITNLVDSFEDSMESVSKDLEVSISNVDEGRVSIDQVDQRMEEMKTSISQTADNIEQIRSAIEEQSEASQSVSSGIADVAESTSSSVTSTDYIVDSMDQLQGFINDRVLSLSGLNLPDKVIKLAQSDHVIWKKRLINMICGKEGLNANELADHHSCRLGKWYDQVTEPAMVNNAAFRALLPPHERVHKHGKQAVKLYNQGHYELALAEIDKVERASVDVLRLLKSLEGQ